MNPYSTYPQPGYGVQYPPIVPPPNQYYGPPPMTAQQNGYNGYPATYQSYRRPSDPGPRPQELSRQLSRRHRSGRRASDDEDARNMPRISQPTRPRKASLRSAITPDHIFISLSSHDIIKFANVTSAILLDDIRKTLKRNWSHGIVSQDDGDFNEWSAKLLGGDVWSAGGDHGIDARRLIRILFTFLAEEGFGYLATVDMGHPMKAPRMVFTSVPPDPQPEYFMISFSLNRRTLTILDSPHDLAVLLGVALRGTAPPTPVGPPSLQSAESARWIGPGAYEVVTSIRGVARQDLATLMGSVLKLIAAEGYRFEASVPLGKAGFLGLRGRREMWMFRRIGSPPKVARPRYR